MAASQTNRYECKLDPETLEKAIKELNEPSNNEDRLQAIDDLKNSYLNQTESEILPLHRSDDSFLLRFLRARKFNQERALKMLVNYHKQRVSWTEVFKNVNNPDRIKHIFDNNLVVVLDGLAKNGSRIVFASPGKSGHNNMMEFVASMFLTVEKLLEREEMQIHGMTVVEDMSNVGFEIARQMGPSTGKRFLGLMQDCLPIRLKGLNMLNESKLFDVIFMIVSPFMKEKTKNRLKLHGSNLSGLRDIIDTNVLPPFLGGTGPELDGKKWGQTVIREGSQL